MLIQSRDHSMLFYGSILICVGSYFVCFFLRLNVHSNTSHFCVLSMEFRMLAALLSSLSNLNRRRSIPNLITSLVMISVA